MQNPERSEGPSKEHDALHSVSEVKGTVTAGPVSRILSRLAARTVIPLRRPLLNGCSDLPGTSTRRGGCPFGLAHRADTQRTYIRVRPLFGLAPCGVCQAPCIAARPVRFYRTFSPLPFRAVCFLWHFPSTGLETSLPDVIRHTALRSSDFPPKTLARLQRPSGPTVNSFIIFDDSARATTRIGMKAAINGVHRLLMLVDAGADDAFGAAERATALRCRT